MDWRGDTPSAPRSSSGASSHGAQAWLENLPVEPNSVIIDYHRDYDLDLTLGGSYLYDSNTFLAPRNEVSSLTGVVDLGVALSKAKQKRGRVDYGLEYMAQYFLYENAVAAGGRDPFEQRLGGFFGLNGPKTTVQVTGNVLDNNSNSIDFSNYDHEVRRANSIDYDVGVTVTRELDHGSIEAGGVWANRDFGPSRQGQLNDYETLSGSLFWFYTPAFASKTNIGLGVAGGRDSSENNFTQTYIEPGVQLRYNATERTQAFGNVGYQMRDYSGGDSLSGSDKVVAGIGAIWNPRDTTRIRISANHSVHPSLSTNQENYTSTGVSALLSQHLPAELVLTAMAAYDLSDYFTTGDQAGSGREDEFLRVGGSLGRQFHLFDKIASSVSVFYYLNNNESSLDDVDFVQQVAGVRVSLNY